MDPLGLFDRLSDQLRRYQFRLPEPALWVLGAAGSAGVAAGAPIVGGPVIAVAAIGIVRRRFHRRRSRGGLVVARFAAPGAEPRQEEVQRLILASLGEKLTPEEAAAVHAVPVVVGRDERAFAIKLRRRLRARFLLHGQITERDAGTYSVYASLAQPIERGVIHVDMATMDVTFEKASWRNLINRLSTALDVIDEDYPLEFASELEAVIRGTAGQLAEDRGDYARAERFLRDALSVAPDSRSHQIDLIRTALARAIFYQDREDEALTMLRNRSADAAAAPELHRNLDGMLFLRDEPDRSAESRAKGEQALRAAVAQRADPQLALSQYNLAMVTDDEEEAARILDDLLQSKTHYRDAWYVMRQRGALAWSEAETTREREGDEAARPRYAQAARLYGKAIRRRPRFKILLAHGSFDFFGYRTPPFMYANASDAHRRADHPFRAGWYAWRGERRRNRWFNRGHRAFKRRQWQKAANLFDHVARVRGDAARTISQTFRAVALKQMGEDEQAEILWRDTLSEDPDALNWRAILVLEESYGLTASDLPGDEPTDVAEVNDLKSALQGGTSGK